MTGRWVVCTTYIYFYLQLVYNAGEPFVTIKALERFRDM